MKDFYLGLDVGGTKCAVILGRCGDTMEIIDRIAFPTEAKKGFDHTIENIYAAIDEMMARHSLSADNVQALGISCGGPLNSKTGRVLSPPNLFGWDDIPIVELMETRYGISTALQNDANACALAEWKFGAAQGCENCVFLTFGTGMGAGLILNGRLYDGTNGMAGEVGHMKLSQTGPVGYGVTGSFEGWCSGGGIAQVAKTYALEQLQMGKTCGFCRNYEEIESTINDIYNKYKKIDILVNNAGISANKTIDNTEISEFDKIIDLNINSMFYVTKAVVPFMKKQKKWYILYVTLIELLEAPALLGAERRILWNKIK